MTNTRYVELAESWIEYLHTVTTDPASIIVLPVQRKWTRRWVLLLCIMEENDDGSAEIRPIAELIGDTLRLRIEGYATPGGAK